MFFTFLACLPLSAQVLQIDDIYRFDAPKATVLSPDGRRAAYIRNWFDKKEERHALWLIDGAKEKAGPLETSEPDARHAVWSPDGKWLAVLSTRKPPKGYKPIPPTPLESDPATDIWLISVEDGAAIPLAGPDKPYGRVFHDQFFGRVAFSPDGKQLVFVADDGIDPRTPDEIANDVQIVRPDQGEAYTGYGPAQVWIAHLDSKPHKIKRLTNDAFWYGDPQWSPDGKSLVVHVNKSNDQEAVRFSINKNYDLWSIDVATGNAEQLTRGPGPEVSPRWSPDGKKIACLSIPRKGTHRDTFNFAVVHLETGGPRTEVVFDHHGPKADDPPHPAPSFPLPDECWESNFLIVYNADIRTESAVVQVDWSNGRGTIVDLAKLVDTQAPKSVLERMTRVRHWKPEGDLFLKDRTLGERKVVTWKNPEGHTIEGVLTLPPAAVAKAPYKVIAYPHGGPHGRSAVAFEFIPHVYAGAGYAVFQPNFRGSSGYGQKFIDADRFDFGGGDARDVLSGLDHFIAEGLFDKDRQFLYGTSYGGFLTTWLIGQTPRFKAAVAQNAVTDLNMFWGLSDIQSWIQWEFGGFPWEVPAALRKMSPITYVANVKTPTLILHARDDRRVPLPLGRAYYQALLSRGVPTQMVIYPNEGHGMRQPRHREDVLRRVLEWYAKHDR